MDKTEFYRNLVANKLNVDLDFDCLRAIADYAFALNTDTPVPRSKASCAAQIHHMQRFNAQFLAAGIDLFSQQDVEDLILSGGWSNDFVLLRDTPEVRYVPVFGSSILERMLIPGDKWDYVPFIKEKFPKFIEMMEALPVKEVRNAIISTFHPWQSTLPHSDLPTASTRAFKDVLALLIAIDDGGSPIVMITPDGKKLTLSEDKVGKVFTFNDHYVHTIAPRQRGACFLRLAVVPNDEFFELIDPTPSADQD